jgi:Transposase IS116/IS110/IS902 family/PilZ domain
MPDVTAELRGAPRYALVLAAEAIELSCGAKLCARTADISRTGCYIDTLNPIREGSRVRLRLTHHDEVLEILGKVSFSCPGLGMGIAECFIAIPPSVSVGPFVAQTVIREVGLDMSRWKTEAHFASWLGLCGDNRISGDKVLARGTHP